MKFLAIITIGVLLVSCGGNQSEEKLDKTIVEEPKVEKAEPIDPMEDKGVGPITSVDIGESIDETLVEKGKALFKVKCTPCHKINKRFVGPALKGVTGKQSPEWIMNMILNPEVMIVENETAKQLLKEFNAPMANQSLTEDEARSILEFLRTKN